MARGVVSRPERAVAVSAPNRVDLAGGTLDIHPLYLLVDGARTVNAAIRVESRVEIRPARGGATLAAVNFGARATAADTHGFPRDGRFGLVATALRAFPPLTAVAISVANEAPVGSGLGASSALLVALLEAMRLLSGRRRDVRGTARLAAEIEAAHLRTLTGCQDHLAALRGGIQGIRFFPGGFEAERIPPAARAGRLLEAHGFLAATGTPHHSGAVNWRMVRRALDGDAPVLRRFGAIARAADEAWRAVAAGEPSLAGRAVAREWAVRRTLAPGVTTRPVESLLASGPFRARVSGAKLCGAGGGGMLFGILKSPDDRARVDALLRAAGFDPWPFALAAGPTASPG